MKYFSTFLLVMVFFTSTLTANEPSEAMKKDGWVSIFNGKTLEGWKSNETYEGFKIENGCIVGFGARNHLYYMEELKNFELKIDVKINQGGNSGVFVKSVWVDNNWPVGYELQVNSSQRDPQKTGTLYNIIKIFKAPHEDDEWFTYHIICKGNTLECRINGNVLYTYVDPMERGGIPVEGNITNENKRISQKGLISLQQHDPTAAPMFKNVFLKKLPD
jgi:hypothetical protein